VSASRNPTLAELLNTLQERTMARIRVAVPGRIVKWSKTTQLCDVQPEVADSWEDETGDYTSSKLPVIQNVPLIQHGNKRFRLTIPVAVGDKVQVLFNDRSLDEWLSHGGETAPEDQRRHHLSDAVAFMGLHPADAPWNGVSDDYITLGSDGGSEDWAALATKVKSEISALRDAFLKHVHNVATVGAPTAQTGITGTPGTTTVVAAILVPPVLGLPKALADMTPAVNDVASATVKVRG
jgi:hypothetical protein